MTVNCRLLCRVKRCILVNIRNIKNLCEILREKEGVNLENQKYLQSKKLSIILFIFVFMLYSVVYMTKSVFSSAMATIVEEGFMTKSQTGLINAVFWFIYAPFQIIGGFAADKYSPYKLVLIGLIGGLIANIIIYFNQSYPVILAAWSFNAVVQFGLWPGVFKIVSTQTAPNIRGVAVFWLLFATSVGLGMGMLVASFVSHWRQNFLVSIVILLITIVSFVFIYNYLDRKMVTKEKKESVKSNPSTKKEPMLPLMHSSGLIVFLVITLLRVAIDNGIKMMTPVMLMESYEKLPAAIATRMSTVLIVFSAIGTLVAGFMKTKVTGNEPKAQIILMGISMPSLLLVCFVGKVHYLWILAALSVATALVHGAAPFGQSYIALRFERYGRIGTVSGILNATASVGNILASYVFAKMAELMPWHMVTASWFSVIIICILLCLTVLRRWTRFIYSN